MDRATDRDPSLDPEVVSQLVQGMLRMRWSPVVEPQYSAMTGALADTPVEALDPLLASNLQRLGLSLISGQTHAGIVWFICAPSC